MSNPPVVVKVVPITSEATTVVKIIPFTSDNDKSVKIVPSPGSKGEPGENGEGFNFRGEWVTDTLYLQNDVVTQNGSSYIANYDYQDTSGPYLDGDLWATFVARGEDGIVFSVGPSNQRTGIGEVLEFTDPAYQSIITGPDASEANPTAQRLVVAGKDGYTGTSGEGGDVYLWAGRGGDAGGSGGDIKVDAGSGGGNDGSGGTIKVRGGYSQTSGGGFVQIYAGDSGLGAGGNLELRAGTNYEDELQSSVGGNISILGGYSANAERGGNIDLTTYNAGKITLLGAGGEFLNDSTNPDNQIATIGDIPASNTADFIFTAEEGQSVISLPGDKQMRIQGGADSDLYLTAGDDLYIQTLGTGDDIIIQAADDVRFTAGTENIEQGGTSYGWIMNSEGELHLPGNGYISNPNATVVTSGYRTATYTDSYLNDQSIIIDQNAVALPVDIDSTWFVNNIYSGIFTSPIVISFADGDSTTAVAIYDATSQGTPAVIFQWNDINRTKTFEQIYPLSVSVNYSITTYDGNPTIVLDPADNNDDQILVIEATQPNHIHLRAGGEIDESTAHLYLGGERNHVTISDSYKSIVVSTAASIENTYVNANEVNNADLIIPDTADIIIGDNVIISGISYTVTYFSPDPLNGGFSIVNATGATFVAGESYTFVREQPYENSWQFNSTGYLYGPAMGGLLVSGLLNGESDLWLSSNDNVVLNGSDGGEFIGDPNNPDNQIATLGDLIPGIQGEQGLKGDKGDKGDAGETGSPGAGFGIYYLGNYVSTNGYVTDIAVVRGSDGQLYLAKASGQLEDPVNYQTNGQWEIWIPKGTDGTNGVDGLDGITGPQGDPGTNGTNGVDGAPGTNGVDGAPGTNGVDGAPGTNGTNGADALWNFTGEWVNGVDYAAGDLVTFNGSLFYTATGVYSSYTPGTPGFDWVLAAEKGEIGATGSTGIGMPIGGAAGQILVKDTATDYDFIWIDNYANWTSQLKHEVKLSATIAKGQAVYISSADGTNMIASKASNAAEPTSSKTIGLLESGGNNNSKVKVITEGLLSGLNTGTANAGDPVWLGTDGNLIYGLINKPVAPAHLVFIGVVTRANSSNGEIFVKVQNGFEIEELHNVVLTNKQDGDFIAWDSANTRWKNVPKVAGIDSDQNILAVQVFG